jgi:spermidine/putrescine transport system substrate-binding protein
MQVPVGAPHAFTAEKLMDFFYQPEVMAEVEAYMQYVPPVKGVKEVLAKKDPKLAESPLIFPDLSKSHNFKTFSPADEAKIDAAYERVIGA